MTKPVDIRADHLEMVRRVLQEHLQGGVAVWVFGSRACGAARRSSDLDLALEGSAKLDPKLLAALENAFEDSDLPYTVDLVDLNAIGGVFEQIVLEQRVPFPSGSPHESEAVMDERRKQQLAGELDQLAQCFWAGEAEICRQFWSVPRTAGEQAHWLRLQVYKEMFGSGLVGHPDGIIRAYIEKLALSLPNAQTKEQRGEFERDVRVLGEEFNHYRLFADILENATGEPVRLENLRGWQLPEDVKLQQLRQRVRESKGRVGEAAIGFTEGGGASFFYEGRSIGGDPLSDQIAEACAIVFGDEAEHGEHGALTLERGLDTEEEWAEARSLVIAICQQRLRMRYEMFALPVDEARIAQITEGKIEPLDLSAKSAG